ncbi:MAG: MBL fold metallo-hydrolase [Cytophagales bacterium]|nr:MAG: MBL fold metallo-hydrolase [Cytophagales bacterium]TAF60570.1 MAG: MBL fold metallo-hydrolase [Cytophagales bacterium]
MIQVRFLTCNAFSENTYILWDETKEAILIDPGCYEKHEFEAFSSFIQQEQLKVVGIYNTHCHIDHVLGCAWAMRTYGIPLYIHELELSNCKMNKIVADRYGFHQYEDFAHTHFLKENDLVQFGKSQLKVLFVPGHSPGHVAFYAAEEKFCINGDVLFKGSIGRSDLPGGNMDQLLKSIQNVMFQLPDDTSVFCGHGEPTTIGYEKIHNPFCGIDA